MGAGALFAASAGMQIVSSIGQGIEAKANGKIQAKQYGIQIAQLEQQKRYWLNNTLQKEHNLKGLSLPKQVQVVSNCRGLLLIV